MQLLVSFGAAGRWSFAALKLIFSLSVGFALTEKITFFANQKFSIQKAYEPPSKAALLHTKALHLHKPFLAVRKYFQFLQTKSFSFAQTFLLPPKATLFHPPLPIPTILNLLSAKNTAILLLFALISYAVKPERRTDSNHCRRYPAKLQLFAKPVT